MTDKKKIPPLTCPKCGSDKVTPSFKKSKRTKGGRYAKVNDGSIYCYGCNHRTYPSGKSKEHPYRAHKFTTEEHFHGKHEEERQ